MSNIQEQFDHHNLLNRFSPEFREKIRINPVYYKIYYMLLQGIDEYVVIEELLKLIEREQQEIIRITEETKHPKYIIRPDNLF